MLDAERLANCTWSINRMTRVVQTTNQTQTVRRFIDPYKPFLGIKGQLYEISYPYELTLHTNCYAFALCWQVRGERGIDFNPGFLSNEIVTIENLKDLVESDLNAVGRRVIDCRKEVPLYLPKPDKGYWIKALYCERIGVNSIHFMVKDPKSGRWLHKIGWDRQPSVVDKILTYKTERELLLESEQLKKYPKEDVEKVLDIIFANGSTGGMMPTRTVLVDKDNEDYVSVSENGVPYTYKTLWAMLISN